MSRLMNRIDRALSFKGLLSLLMVFLMLFSLIPLRTQVQAVGPKKASDVDYNKPVIVSMGDSYSSGEGIEEFYCQELSNKEKVKEEDWLAHRSKESWPGQLKFPGLDYQAKEYKDKNWFFVASSGATTEHLSKAQPKPYEIGAVGQYSDPDATVTKQLAIFDELEKNSVDYVTLTLGGNDADFTGVITEAVMGSTYLNTSNLSDMLADIWDRYYEKGGIRDDLYNSYKKIEKAAGAQAQIIVAGYPKLLEQSGKGALFSQEEAREINRAVSNFNIEIERVVEYCADEDMKICFVSVEEAFDGHEAYSRNPYINEVYLLQSKPEELQNFVKASAYSMHPNKTGAREGYAKCVNAKIEKLAEDEEKRLEEEALNPSKKDREIVLVLDRSGSMSGTPMQETLKAAHQFVGTVFATEANVGVVAYENSATVISALTDSQAYLDKRIDEIRASGGTDIEDGLKMADGMLSNSKAKKKIIVLMSDGEPNDGKVGQALIDYADTLKAKGYDIYTLGFFSAIGNKDAAQSLMEKIASTGCHYEVDSAEKLQFFFGDIADQITGTNYIYVRIACPVDVTVKYNGEEMTSKGNFSSLRSSFGTMTFEEAVEIPVEETETVEEEEINPGGSVIGYPSMDSEDEEEVTEIDEGDVYDNRVKILRLKEGVDYDILIEGNGKGVMNYSIGFMDEKGEYSDMRLFPDIEIAPATKIDTVATKAEETYMYVDEDGDGEYDVTYMAKEGSEAEIVDDEPVKKKDYTLLYVGIGAIALLAVAAVVFVLIRRNEIKKYLPA